MHGGMTAIQSQRRANLVGTIIFISEFIDIHRGSGRRSRQFMVLMSVANPSC